jgi:uncharacterized protein (TIGR02598 family)
MCPRKTFSFPGKARKGAPAFSLVEVALALGIISFALLTVAGLMPVGLGTMRQAMDNTEESQIIRTISGEVLMTPFSELDTNFAGKTFYFDDEGTLLTNSPANAPAGTRYWATTSLANPSYPGSTNDVLTNSISTVKLQILTAGSATAALKSTNTCYIEVANSGN